MRRGISVISTENRLKLAVFIDFDNIEIGVKTTLNSTFDIGVVLEALRERGEVVSKVAYSDWKRAGDYSRSLSQHAIKMVQRNLTPGGDKNGADINLALDALEMAFTHPHINAYVIVGGDSDFITLVEKLKQYDKQVLVVGGRSFTSVIMQRNCNEFIAYENLVSTNGRRSSERERQTPRTEKTPIDQAVPLVKRALELLSDREVSPQLGLLKSTLLQLDSTFSERSYGASSFRDFAEKLETAGLVTLRHAGRNILVELRDSEPHDGHHAHRPATVTGEPARTEEHARTEEPARHGTVEQEAAAADVVAAAPEPEASAPKAADGLAQIRRLLAKSKPTRFPMYIRNVKQLLRQVDPTFDERKYGFTGLVDLLRAAQRENMVRLERDRQGALRVFQGSQWPVEQPPVVDGEPVDTPPAEAPITDDDVTVIVEEAVEVPEAVATEAVGEVKPAKRTRRPRRAKPAAQAETDTTAPGPEEPRSARARKGSRRPSLKAEGGTGRRRAPRKPEKGPGTVS
jgi:uncharacterized LabA/DUF88 family protein